MTHRQPKFSQVLVCEIGQDAKIDIVLSKALGVLGHAEFFEPVRNCLHRGPFLPHRFIEPSFWTGQRRV